MDTAPTEEKDDIQSGLKRSFFNGIFQGAGAIVGSVLALVVLGWLLSILGILPGFGSVAAYLHGVVDRFNTRY